MKIEIMPHALRAAPSPRASPRVPPLATMANVTVEAAVFASSEGGDADGVLFDALCRAMRDQAAFCVPTTGVLATDGRGGNVTRLSL